MHQNSRIQQILHCIEFDFYKQYTMFVYLFNTLTNALVNGTNNSDRKMDCSRTYLDSEVQ